MATKNSLRKGRILIVKMHPEARGGSAHCSKMFVYMNGTPADVPFGTTLYFPSGIETKNTMPDGSRMHGNRFQKGVTMKLVPDEVGEPYLHPASTERGLQLRFALEGNKAKVISVPSASPL